MVKKIATGAAIAACAALSLQVRADAQAKAAPAQRSVGITIAGDNAYPTDEQWKDSKEAQALVARARTAAGTDPVLKARFDKVCTALGPQVPSLLIRNAGKTPPPPRKLEPIRIFDNLYFIGYDTIGAWAIPTSQGIILIDSLNTPDEAEHIIEPSLKKIGLNPADVKMIIVGHGHFDHFGGAPYFQQKYGSHVAMSKADWDMIATPQGAGGPNANHALPKRDVEVTTNGQTITLGDETITLYITPGHTPGSLAYIIPVKDHGKPMNILMLSGANIVPNRASLAAFDRALDAGKAAKVQAVINGHPGNFGDEMAWMEALQKNPNGPNGFVMTVPEFARFIDMMRDCADARIVAATYRRN